jgi:hydrogenase maturation protease
LPPKLRTMVIGVGNDYSGDDAAGLLAARRLRELASYRALIREETGDGARLIESWKGTETVIVLDAVYSGAKPGTIHRLDAQTQRVPRDLFRYSTHAFSVADAIELARVLNTLPTRLVIYGIEGRNFRAGASLSQEVENAIQETAELVLEQLRSDA